MKETKYDIKEIGTVVFTEEEALLKTEKKFFIHLFDKDYKIPIIFNLREEKLFQDKQCKFPICISCEPHFSYSAFINLTAYPCSSSHIQSNKNLI